MEAAKYVPSLCMPNYSLMAWHIEAPTIHGLSQRMHRSIATIATLIDAKSFSNIMMMMMMLLHLDWC